MRGSNPAWLVVIAEDDHLSSGILCGRMIKRTKTSASVLALVSSNVSRDSISKLHSTFELVLFAQDITAEGDKNYTNLKQRDALLLQSLKFSSFSKIVVIDPGVLVLHQSDHLFDKYDVFVSNKGEWRLVTVIPNVSKWKNTVDIIGNSEGILSSSDFTNLLITHFGGIVKKLGNIDSNIDKFDGKQNSFLEVDVSLGNAHLTKELYKYGIDFDIEQTLSSPFPDQDEAGKERKTWIAIVGMSCRFPGANSVDEYWEILKSGLNTASPPSQHRLLLSSLDTNVKANFLKCPIDEFDAKFFGMSPSEAALTDVQARFLLEVSWEAFEDAGVNQEKLRGTHTGIFHGSWIQDYKECLNNAQPPNQEFMRKYIGNSFGSTAAKLSFFYGLTGPNVATDSGCSSSMMAVDLACKSLLQGECPLAVATGSNIILQFDTKSKVVWAEDGICKAFDSNANGYGRAEGVAALVLKRYSGAIQDNDRIHGIIRGSASTQEGLSRSFGTPTVDNEAMAMKNALIKSGVSPEEVDYVEAHATGTGVGDPIEAAAISRAYSSSTGLRSNPLWIGSGKTNIGHTESCSGLAGIIKVLLALKHELIPPHIHLKQLNPKVSFEQIPGKIPVEAVPWKRSLTRARIAGISNFGITGTDAHMIIQEAPNEAKTESFQKQQGVPFHVLAISAKTNGALEQLTNSYIKHFQTVIQNDEEYNILGNIAYTANARRFHHLSCRKVVIGRNKNELIAALHKNSNDISDRIRSHSLKTCMVFHHQPFNNLALRNYYSCLYSSSPIFKKYMGECDRICKKLYGFATSDYLIAGRNVEEIQQKDNQLCSFSVSYSLVKLWESWGVKPDVVVGHGFGELPGRVAAGLLTLEECIKIIADSSAIEKLTMGLENGTKTSKILYISGRIESGELCEAVTAHRCDVCIQVGLEESIIPLNESMLHFPNTTDMKMDNLTEAERSWLPLISTLASLYKVGYNIDLAGFYTPYQSQFQIVSLPHYPFQRKPYWFTREKVARTATHLEIAPHQIQIHPLLGVPFTNALTTNTNDIYQNWLTTSPPKASFLKDHVIETEVIFPAAGYLEMALAARAWNFDPKLVENIPIVIENFTVHRPLHLQIGNSKTVQTIVKHSSSEQDLARITFHGKLETLSNNWTLYASCDLPRLPTSNKFEKQFEIEYLKTELNSVGNDVPAKWYDDFSNVGLRFGPRFQSLQKIHHCKGETLGQLATIPEAELRNYICHPLLVDAMLQCFILHKEPTPTTLQVPVAIREFICYSRPSSFSSQEFYVYCNAQAEIVYLLDSKNNVVALMYEPVLKKTTVGSMLKAAGVKEGLNVQELDKYEIYWKPSPNSYQLDSLMTLQETENYTETPSFNSLLQYFKERSWFTRRENELDENIDRLAGLYVLNALYELGWKPRVNESFNINELAEKLNVANGFIPAFHHFSTTFLTDKLNVLRKFPSSSNSQKIIVTEALKSPDEVKREINKILAICSNYAPLGSVIHPCGSQLAAVFQGKVNGHDILFNEDYLAQFYYESNRFFNDGMKGTSKVFGEVSREMWKREGGRDAGKIMRILQIGNGSQKFTSQVLEALDEDNIEHQYWLTNFSPEMRLEQGESQLSMYANNLVLKQLDIGVNPLDQGFPAGYFDIVVILLGVLHSTKNLRKSLENVRQLMKIGGMLIVEELNGLISEIDIVFGVLENFWSYEDFDVRPTHCAVNLEQWGNLMEDVGFRSIQKILLSGAKMGVLVGQLQKRPFHLEINQNINENKKSWLVLCNKDINLVEHIELHLTSLRRDLVVLNFHEIGGNSVEEALLNLSTSLEGILFVVEGNNKIDTDSSNYRILLEPLLHLSKCLIKLNWKTCMPKLVVASKGCSPIAATLWGFVRTAQFEIPDLTTKLIDLDPNTSIEERVQLLFHELWTATGDDESEVQYRNRIRSVRRLRNSISDAAIAKKQLEEPLFNSQSTYLITGGKGAIGLAIAEWMISQGAQYLVLLGRSPPNGKTVEKIKSLEKNGAKVLCLEVDISDYGHCKKVLEDIESIYNLPPLRGIHHLAGVLSDKMILNQTWEDFELVLAPKVKGAYNMHKLTKGLPLQFFVVHSSMSATLGNAGQSNYTAANAYMKALIEMRHSMGLQGLCVSWGQWNTGLGENLDLKIFHAFSTAQGIQALEQIFKNGNNDQASCVAVGSIKLNELVKLRPNYEKTLLEDIVRTQNSDMGERETIDVGKRDKENKENFLEIYRKAEGDQEKELAIKNFVKELVCETLGVTSQEVEDDTLFSNMGMDSLVNIEFYNKMQLQLGHVKLGFVDMEEYGTVSKMSEIIKKWLDSS